MPRLSLARSSDPAFDAGVDYNASNGRATLAYCQNDSGQPLTLHVKLGTFDDVVTVQPGLTTRNLPANALTITILPDGGYTASADFSVEVMT